MRTVVRQDASEATSWLGRVWDLRHDPVTDHLLARDIHDHRIVEFTTSGEFVGYFGQFGEGPGEMRNLRVFEVWNDHVIALDQGNGKLVVFDRATRRLKTEVSLDRFARDITILGDTLAAVMPGPNGALYELFEPGGRNLGVVGDGGFVAAPCRTCSITSIGRELIAIMKPEVPEGRIYRLDGNLYDAFAFTELNHVLHEWREDFLEHIRRASGMAAAGGEGRIAAGKLWAGTATGALGGGSFFVNANPENMDVNPAEFWVLDCRGRVTKRYVFDRPRIVASTVSGRRIFALGTGREFGVYEYRLPADGIPRPGSAAATGRSNQC